MKLKNHNVDIFPTVFIGISLVMLLDREFYKNENLQLKNEKADAFCKSQSYEAEIEKNNFETGYYNQTDNNFYCQAEQEEGMFCYDETKYNGIELNRKALPSCQELIKGVVEYKLEYQKVEKFPYK